MFFHIVFRISTETPNWKKKIFLSIALQQNREHVAQAYFEIQGEK